MITQVIYLQRHKYGLFRNVSKSPGDIIYSNRMLCVCVGFYMSFYWCSFLFSTYEGGRVTRKMFSTSTSW